MTQIRNERLSINLCLPHGLVDHGEERTQSTQSREIHDVVQVLHGVIQRPQDQRISGEEARQDVRHVPLDLQSRRNDRLLGRRPTSVFLGPGRHPNHRHVVVSLLERNVLQPEQEVLADHVVAEHVAREPDHAAAGHGGQRRVLEVLDFEHDPDVGRDAEALAVGQSEQLVVVEDGVQVFDPLGVDVAVEDYPLPLVQLTANVVDDFSEDVSEETVRPFARVRVHRSVQGLWKISTKKKKRLALHHIHVTAEQRK